MRWFVTVDELENKRVSGDESVADGFARLRAALGSAVALRDAGCEFVVAPAPARDGEPVVRVGERYRLGWNVKDTAADAARFFRPHSDSADDVKTWKLLNLLVNGAGG